MIDEDDEPQMVIVCAGPPRCQLNGDEAYEAQRAGCVWCRRIAYHPDGRETVTEPGNA